MKPLERILQKWSLALKVLPILLLVVALKLLSHTYGFEVIELNALFTSIVASTVFLLGFLVSGVLSDYKESEKIPSELAASLETLFDDAYTIHKGKGSQAAQQLIEHHRSLMSALNEWFYRRIRTQAVLELIGGMNAFFIALENEGVQANYIIRMKNEQSVIRRAVLRIHTIRDTEFVQSAYAIVEALGCAIAFGMVLIRIEPFYESLFFTVLVTFLIAYMFFLIKDLDNPFDYSAHGETGTEIPLKPLHDLALRLKGDG